MNWYARRRVWKRLRVPAEAKKGPPAFEPPKYLASLIDSINDGAKAAQTGALFFAFIGLYLLAVAFSTVDEDLLRERTIAVSQLGMAVPVVFSFAVAPIIFVFLHLHTMIRYDMLSANLWQFDRELLAFPHKDDRERSRHLLANIEFLREQGARPGTPLTSRVFQAMGWFILAGFPMLVLTIIQLSALRYQDNGIVLMQRIALAADLVLLVWFFHRQWRMRQDGNAVSVWGSCANVARFSLWAAPIAIANLCWMGVPGPDAKTVGRNAEHDYEALRKSLEAMPPVAVSVKGVWTWLSAWQPVDQLVCKYLPLGCRYLRVRHTLLMAVNPSAEILARLRTDQGQASYSDINSLEGLNLRGRTLRFADLEDSRLYAAAVTGADLRGAYLSQASLQSANLSHVNLRGANLGGAQLQGADLSSAGLEGANLSHVNLTGANLGGAQLQGANLSHVNLTGANLGGAQLQGVDLSSAGLQGTNLSRADLRGANLAALANLTGANLGGAQLQGADLRYAWLQGAYLFSAQLQGADLRYAWLQGAMLDAAQLQGADLRYARLQGAMLDAAQLQGADLRYAQLWQTKIGGVFPYGNSDLSLADLRFVYFDAPTENERLTWLGVPDQAQRERIESALTPQTPPLLGVSDVTVDVFVLVDDPDDTHWSAIAKDKKTTDEAEYERALAPYLAKLAELDAFVAKSIARRFDWPDLAQRLLDGWTAGKIELPDDVAAGLKEIAARAPTTGVATPKP